MAPPLNGTCLWQPAARQRAGCRVAARLAVWLGGKSQEDLLVKEIFLEVKLPGP